MMLATIERFKDLIHGRLIKWFADNNSASGSWSNQLSNRGGAARDCNNVQMCFLATQAKTTQTFVLAIALREKIYQTI